MQESSKKAQWMIILVGHKVPFQASYTPIVLGQLSIKWQRKHKVDK